MDVLLEQSVQAPQRHSLQNGKPNPFNSDWEVEIDIDSIRVKQANLTIGSRSPI